MSIKNLDNMGSEYKFIRYCKTVCPICVKEVEGRLIEEKGSVYLIKKCLKHGKFKVLLFKDMSFFNELNQAYNIFPKNKIQIANKECFNILLSYGCDLNACSCCKNSDSYLRPSFNLIKKKINSFRNARINILGAHLTLKNDLIKLIKLIKKSNNVSILYSQGPLLANELLLKKLRKEGLDKVVLFFDSFDEEINKKLKGKGLLKIKEKALSNLKKLNIPTIINMTVLKNKNEKDVMKIVNLARENKFIRIIEFRGYFPLCGYCLSSNIQLGIDEIIDIIGKGTNQKVSKDKVMIYQKLVYYFFNLMPGYLLLEQPSYILFKDKSKSYKVISDIFDFKRIKRKVDKIYKLNREGKNIRANFIFLSIFFGLIIKLSFNNLTAIPFLFLNRWLNRFIKPCSVCDISLNDVCFLYFGVRENSIEYSYNNQQVKNKKALNFVPIFNQV